MKTISAVIAALLSVTALAPAAFAAHPTTADAPVTSSAPGAVGTAVTTQGPLSGELEVLEGVPLSADGELQARVLATNTTDAALDEVVLRLDLTRQPLTNRGELADFLADPASLTYHAVAQEPPVANVEDDESTAEPTSADAGNAAVDAPGFTQGAIGTTVPQSGDDDDPPEPVGVRIGPHAEATFTLTAPVDELGLPARGWGVYGATLSLVTADEEVLVDSFALTWGAQSVPQLDVAVLATAHGAPSRMLSVLEASNLPGVAVAVDPTHLTTANAISTDLHDREVLRLPVHHPDLTSIAHSENNNLMPLALALSGYDNIPAVTAAPWLAMPGALDATSLSMAADLDARAVLALPGMPGFERVAEAASGPVVRAHTASVLVPDVELSQAVAQYRPGSPAAAALAVADSALLASENNGSAVLVALDERWHIGAGAQTSLRALLDAPWVSPVTVESLLADPAPQVSLTQTLDADSDLPAQQVERLGQHLDALTLLATVAESPEDALNEWGRELLRGISVSERGNAFTADAAVRNALEKANATLSAVRIADSSELNLLTESGDIPVNVVNSLDHAVTVTVNLNSFSSNLQILDAPTVTVPPKSDQVVLVPVEAVSNANVFVAADLRNAGDEPVSDTQPFSVRVRADWGNAATAVFTVMLVLLLVAGLIRTIRRGRKDTRVEPSAPPETMTGEHD